MATDLKRELSRLFILPVIIFTEFSSDKTAYAKKKQYWKMVCPIHIEMMMANSNMIEYKAQRKACCKLEEL